MDKFFKSFKIHRTYRWYTTQGVATTKPGLSHPPDLAFQWGRGPRRRSADSVTDLPLGLVETIMLIVARGCVEQYSCRFTHFEASAVSRAVVGAA